uniref:CSON012470 protein n=1 Tax=Culicoides sonorensis TaxID=179676 RepID=A0A336KJV3_CULSO
MYLGQVTSTQIGKILDTWGKMPAGLHSGNKIDFGHYDQCIRLEHTATIPEYEVIKSQHCQIPVYDLGAQRNTSFVMSICAPRTCKPKIVYEIMNEFLTKNVNYGVSYRELQCVDGTKPKFGAIEWTTTSIFIILGVMIVFSTIYDYTLSWNDEKASPLILSFSLYHNADKLFYQSGRATTFECINGIRVLSMAWLVMLHCYGGEWFFPAVYNKIDIFEFKKTFGYTFNVHGDLAMDTFILLSPFLITYSFMKAQEKGEKFNILKFYLHRYLRLMPLFGALILIILAYLKYLGDGPAYDSVIEATLEKKCRTYWWTSLLFIQNYYNPFNECIGPSWYLSLDMQLVVVTPLFLFPLRKYGYRFMPIMIIVTLISGANVFRLCLMEKYTFSERDGWFQKVYYPTHNRIGVWLIGMGLGYILFVSKNKRITMRKEIQLLLWILSFGTMVTAVVSPYPFYHNESPDIIYFAFYQLLHRLLWALSVSWIIFACCKGNGGIVNWILSFPIYQTLAKLTFSIFLLHYPILIYIRASMRTPEYWSPLQIFFYFMAVWGFSLLLAIPCHLIFEAPLPNVETSIYKMLAEHKLNKEKDPSRNFFRIPRIRNMVSPYPFYHNESPDIIYFAFYQLLHRLLWALSVSWIIFACCKGNGGIVNWILSLPIYQTLAKLTFGVFLLHYPILIYMKSFMRTPDFFSPMQLFFYFMAVWGFSLLLAIPCHLIFEAPLPNVETSVYKMLAEHKLNKEKDPSKNFFRIPRIRSLK